MAAHVHRQGDRGTILSRRLTERYEPPKRWGKSRATREDLVAMARLILSRARGMEREPIKAAIRDLERSANGRRAG
jgi:hypothetical protein